jgi:hypothetical protein
MMRRCSRCGLTLDGIEADAFFRSKGPNALGPKKQRRTVCIGCEQTASDTAKRRNRWVSKVASTTRNHAERLSRRWPDINSADVLVDRYGWHPARMAHDGAHAYGNGCDYCGKGYVEMGHGLADITLDLCDPDDPPYYPGNTRWCCMTCNRKKHRMTKRQWAAQLAVWPRWVRNAEREWPADSLFGFDPGSVA